MINLRLGLENTHVTLQSHIWTKRTWAANAQIMLFCLKEIWYTYFLNLPNFLKFGENLLTALWTSFMFLLDSSLLSEVAMGADSSCPSTWQKTIGSFLWRRTCAGQKETGLGARDFTTSAVRSFLL